MEAVCGYLDALQSATQAIGLTLNLAKCQLWGPGTTCIVGAGIPFPRGTPLDSPIRAVPVVDFHAGLGIAVLGCPVDSGRPLPRGTRPHSEHTWAKAANEASNLLRRLRLLPEGQLQHTLLRHSLDACKVNHLLRATPFPSGQAAAIAFSDHIRRILEDIIGCPLTELAWRQATLPVSKGGLGIRDPL